jgi:hypothetical protein
MHSQATLVHLKRIKNKTHCIKPLFAKQKGVSQHG